MSHLLSAYGLTFRNDAPDLLQLPFVPVEDAAATAQVTLCIGEVPQALTGRHLASNHMWQAAPGRFLFRDTPVGRFLAENGTRITVAPAPEATPEDLTLYLLGSVIAALLKQRGFVTFHASAVLIGGKAVLFAGHSGAGKSTLLAELMRRGHPALADDVSAVWLAPDGTPMVAPGYARTRLWAETIEAFAHLDAKQALGPVRQDLPKFVLPVQRLSSEAAPLAVTFLLTGSQEAPASPAGAGLLNALQQICFRRRTIKPLGVHVGHFQVFTRVAQTTAVETLARPGPGFSVAAMADQVEARLAAGALIQA